MATTLDCVLKIYFYKDLQLLISRIPFKSNERLQFQQPWTNYQTELTLYSVTPSFRRKSKGTLVRGATKSRGLDQGWVELKGRGEKSSGAVSATPRNVRLRSIRSLPLTITDGSPPACAGTFVDQGRPLCFTPPLTLSATPLTPCGLHRPPHTTPAGAQPRLPTVGGLPPLLIARNQCRRRCGVGEKEGRGEGWGL